MKEVVTREIELGFRISEKKIAARIEQITQEMQKKGYKYVKSQTEEHIKHIILVFEKEIDVK